jgi:glycosyltransferase
MKITIITASLNNEKTIEETLISVKNQSYNNIEHIIIDGNSSDSTLEIISRYPHISKIISEKDKGIYFALNKGIKNASGDIIGFLHADDFLASNTIIEKIANIFVSDKDTDAIYGNLQYISNNKNKIIRNWIAGEFKKEKLKKGWMPPHPTFYAKKILFDKIAYFNTKYKISADYDLMIKFLKTNIKIQYINETLVKMKWGGASNKNLAHIFQKSKEDFEIIKENNIGGLKTLLYKNFSKIKQFSK